MKNKKVFLSAGAIVAIGVAIYFSIFNKPKESPQVATSTPVKYQTPPPVVKANEYKNTKYGFAFTLPKNWEEYSIVEDEWEGNSVNAGGQAETGVESGPIISIRHPDWDYKSPRQDIPIMVLTLSQWNDMEAGKFHIGAAPINPTELGRNKKYVFAIPARYNFSYMTGYEEVDEILHTLPLKAF